MLNQSSIDSPLKQVAFSRHVSTHARTARYAAVVAALAGVVQMPRSALAQPALWNDEATLYTAPETRGLNGTALHKFEFKSFPACGQERWNTSWYAAPPGASADTKVPAVINLHGGGCGGDPNGGPLRKWVEAWAEQGFAAISITLDQPGCPDVPITEPEHYGIYQDVADAVLANSLLRSFPEIDAERIGVAGVSWGGHKTCLLSAIDSRLRFAIPIYGAGFMNEEPRWNMEIFSNLSPADAANWSRWFDPSNYLPSTTMPVLWLTTLNDQFWGQVGYRKSFRLVKGPRTVAVHRDFGHDCTTVIDKDIPSPMIFAKSIVSGGIPLPEILETGVDQDTAWVKFDSQASAVRAFFHSTTSTEDDSHMWQWLDGQPATLTDGKAAYLMPAGTTRYYFVIEDERGAAVTSEYVDRLKGETGGIVPRPVVNAGGGGAGGGVSFGGVSNVPVGGAPGTGGASAPGTGGASVNAEPPAANGGGDAAPRPSAGAPSGCRTAPGRPGSRSHALLWTIGLLAFCSRFRGARPKQSVRESSTSGRVPWSRSPKVV